MSLRLCVKYVHLEAWRRSETENVQEPKVTNSLNLKYIQFMIIYGKKSIKLSEFGR